MMERTREKKCHEWPLQAVGAGAAPPRLLPRHELPQYRPRRRDARVEVAGIGLRGGFVRGDGTLFTRST